MKLLVSILILLFGIMANASNNVEKMDCVYYVQEAKKIKHSIEYFTGMDPMAGLSFAANAMLAQTICTLELKSHNLLDDEITNNEAIEKFSTIMSRACMRAGEKHAAEITDDEGEKTIEAVHWASQCGLSQAENLLSILTLINN